jgi:hypothetical protein
MRRALPALIVVVAIAPADAYAAMLAPTLRIDRDLALSLRFDRDRAPDPRTAGNESAFWLVEWAASTVAHVMITAVALSPAMVLSFAGGSGFFFGTSSAIFAASTIGALAAVVLAPMGGAAVVHWLASEFDGVESDLPAVIAYTCLGYAASSLGAFFVSVALSALFLSLGGAVAAVVVQIVLALLITGIPVWVVNSGAADAPFDANRIFGRCADADPPRLLPFASVLAVAF